MLAERIVEPRAHEEAKPVEPVAPVVEEPLPSYASDSFKDPSPTQPFDAKELGFSFEEEQPIADSQPKSLDPATRPQQAQPRRRAKKPVAKKILGMTTAQFIVIAGMVAFWLCLMLAFGAFIYFTQ